jgi:gliding motility-associated-like protein
MGGIPKTFLLLAAILTGLSSGAGVRVQDFSFSGVSNRFITPNGDGKNDNVAFQFSNPRDSAGTVKIYNMRGHLMTTIAVNPGDVSEIWDARANGQVVSSGVYVYVVSVESVVASGTVVVVR